MLNDAASDLCGTEDSDEELKTVKLSVSVRTFIGNSSGLNVGSWEICFYNLEQFKVKLWEKVRPNLKREIIIEMEQPPRWSDRIELEMNDLESFVQFHNKVAHRKYKWSQLTLNLVSGWADKEIWLYIHIYSNSMSSKNVFDSCTLLKTSATDRSGANTTAALRSLSSTLKEKHGGYYEALDIHWDLWATIIQGSEPHLHQQLIDGPPPSNIRHWFIAARTNPDARMENVRDGNAIGRYINERHHSREVSIRESLTNLISIRDNLNRTIDDLGSQLNACDIEANVSEELMARVEQTLRPQENEYSLEVLQQVQDQQDIDHE